MTESITDIDKEEVEFNMAKFMGQFGVTRDQLPLVLECLLNMSEQVSATCLLPARTLLHRGEVGEEGILTCSGGGGR